MKKQFHKWEPHPDSETIRRPLERVRYCTRCKVEQTWSSDHEWGRVVRRFWWPSAGRFCPGLSKKK